LIPATAYIQINFAQDCETIRHYAHHLRGSNIRASSFSPGKGALVMNEEQNA
jgi:hypothetical protein